MPIDEPDARGGREMFVDDPFKGEVRPFALMAAEIRSVGVRVLPFDPGVEQCVGMLHSKRLKPTIAPLKDDPRRVLTRLPVDKRFTHWLTKLIECLHLNVRDVEKSSRLVNCWFLKKNHCAMF